MAEADSPQLRVTRKSYTRETKLEVVRFYHENSLYLTAKKFGLNTKVILRWVKQNGDFSKQEKLSTGDDSESRKASRNGKTFAR